ncbi:MAG: hypothetical protein KF911_08135 [Pseudomonadales bacterium]|nr:hypothetical protein [Pseudomonadales bacterium]
MVRSHSCRAWPHSARVVRSRQSTASDGVPAVQPTTITDRPDALSERAALTETMAESLTQVMTEVTTEVTTEHS